VLLRSILDAETVSDAVEALLRGRRASSANYLVAHEDGVALDLEAAPGDYTKLFVGYPQDDLVLHTNHFVNSDFDERDVSLVVTPDSPFRLARLQQLVRAESGPLDAAFWMGALGDHAMFPHAVCCHPDPRDAAPQDHYATVASVVMDLRARRLLLASGNPCEAPFEALDYAAFLSKQPAVRPLAA
jgi:isopenicillin-N N-acyltransferase-like protein